MLLKEDNVILGTFVMLVTYLIIWGGQSLLAMKIMQVTAHPLAHPIVLTITFRKRM